MAKGKHNKRNVRGPFCSIPDRVLINKGDKNREYNEEVRAYNKDLREFADNNIKRKRDAEAVSDDEDEEFVIQTKKRRKMATIKAKEAEEEEAAAAAAASEKKKTAMKKKVSKKAAAPADPNAISDDEDCAQADPNAVSDVEEETEAAEEKTEKLDAEEVSNMGKKSKQKVQRLKKEGTFFCQEKSCVDKTVKELMKLDKTVQFAAKDCIDEECLRKNFKDMGGACKYFQSKKYKIRYCLSKHDVPVCQIYRDWLA